MGVSFQKREIEGEISACGATRGGRRATAEYARLIASAHSPNLRRPPCLAASLAFERVTFRF